METKYDSFIVQGKKKKKHLLGCPFSTKKKRAQKSNTLSQINYFMLNIFGEKTTRKIMFKSIMKSLKYGLPLAIQFKIRL